MRESASASHTRLEAANCGDLLWRNNSGGFYDDTGRFIRFGLGNFTEEDKKKSPDYVGIHRRLITQEMVGTYIGQFLCVETKDSEWVFSSADKRSLYQLNFMNIVVQNGGLAGFARNPEDFRRIIGL